MYEPFNKPKYVVESLSMLIKIYLASIVISAVVGAFIGSMFSLETVGAAVIGAVGGLLGTTINIFFN